MFTAENKNSIIALLNICNNMRTRVADSGVAQSALGAGLPGCTCWGTSTIDKNFDQWFSNFVMLWTFKSCPNYTKGPRNQTIYNSCIQ